MTNPESSLDYPESKGQVILGYVLLALCLCVIVCRATYTESPNVASITMLVDFTSPLKSLTISAVLLFSAVVWFVSAALRKNWRYRYTGIEIGLAIFVVAGIIGMAVAANKRAAVTGFVTLSVPMVMAILLVQILNSQTKTTILLYAVVALGVIGTSQCAEQFFSTNEMLLEQYRQSPEEQLSMLGIEPNTFQHFLYEHRLFSRDVHGFFTTSNSAGSFALLSVFAAAGLFIERFRNRQSDPSKTVRLFTTGIVTIAILMTFVFTQSKGAIAGALVALTMLLIYLAFGQKLRAHRKIVLLIVVCLAVLAGTAAIIYGLGHGKLPGGNSMLVRWQYWSASAKMYADYPFWGVGPGNFVHFYPHYKVPSALETISDPHNFLLSILTQYGPLGLVGFLAAIAVPLWRVVFTPAAKRSEFSFEARPTFKPAIIIFMVILSAALLALRPWLVGAELGETPDVRLYMAIYWYVVPVVVFVLAYLFLSVKGPMQLGSGVIAALFCATVGILAHNCLDFALFEPGVLTTFWALVACLIALDFDVKGRCGLVLTPGIFARILMVVGAVAIVGVFCVYALLPLAKTGIKTTRAMQELRYTHELLGQAAKDDPLDPATLNLNGKFYLQHYNETGRKQPLLLEKGAACFLGAIERNGADFKSHEQLIMVYNLLAETSMGQAKTDWLTKAFDSAQEAINRYPGGGRLYFKRAKIAEQLGKTSLAIEHYQKAVEIEDKYRLQFQIMYPAWSVVSRLGEEKYQFAKQRIKLLSKQPTT